MVFGGDNDDDPGLPGSTVVELAAGEALITEGEEGDDVFFVRSGQLEVSCRSGDDELSLGRRRAGDLVGEMSDPNGGRRTASVRALTPVRVVRVSRANFDAWMSADEERATAISELSRRRVDETQMHTFLTRIAGQEHHEVISEIVAAVSWLHAGAGSVIFAQGDESDAAYFVVAGRLRISGTDLDGHVAFDHELGRGDVVGEMGLIDVAPRSGTLVALRDATLATLSLETFQRLMVEHPAVMLRIFRQLLARMTRPQIRSASARSITVAVTSPTDRRVFAAQLAEEIGRHGSVRQIRAASVDAELRSQGISQAALGTAASSRVVNLLHEHQVSTDYLLYETDALHRPGPLSVWSERAIRQADRLALVCSAAPGPDEAAMIGRVLDAASDAGHLEVWAVVEHPVDTDHPDTVGHPVDGRVQETHHLHSGRRSDIERLARLLSGNGVAVVLSGGGARGYAHLGAVKALLEHGVPIDRIGGSSMGSVIAAGFARGWPADELAGELQRLMSEPIDYTIPVVALAKGERVANACNEFFGTSRIEDLWLPFYCVSTNLTRARVELHRAGAVAEAIRASVAIPGVFPPVPKRRDLLVDGGVLNNVPVDVVAEDPSIKYVIAIEVAPPMGPRAKSDFGLSVSGWSALRSTLGKGRSEFPAVTSVLMSSLLVGSTRDRRQFVADGMVDLLLNLNVAGVGLLDFAEVAPVMERGYELALPKVVAWAEEQGWTSRRAGGR